jgi:hypothetical protein
MSDPFITVGDPGRAAQDVPDGPPGLGRSGPSDIELSAASMPGMLIRAASVRGLLHRARSTPRQDAFAIASRRVPGEMDRAVAVVCDGVGQFGRSDHAAALASRQLADLGAQGVPWPEAFSCVNEQLQKDVAEALVAESADAAANGMATTALAVEVRWEAGAWLGTATWVGDSTLWHLSVGQGWRQFGESTETVSEYHSTAVTALPSAGAPWSSENFRVAGGALFLMSDGVANPLKWSGQVRRALTDWWSKPPGPLSFAAQVGFARKSHQDDRTVIGIWPDGSDVNAGQEG